MMKIDLHLHSTASDGSCTPAELMDKLIRQGYSAAALADHDTLQGVAEARARAEQIGLAFLPCVELSVGIHLEIHLLGYGIDENAPLLCRLLDEMRQDREGRIRAMAEKLKKAGYEVEYADIRAKADGVVGRPHLAQALVECGAAKSVSECFVRFIGRDAPYYVPRKKVSTRDGIEAVRQAGGIPVLAHPGQLRLDQAGLFSQIRSMREEGLGGLECYHNAHAPRMQDWLREVCSSLDLLVTGGSDYHGTAKPNVRIGSGLERWIDAQQCLERLQAAIGHAG